MRIRVGFPGAGVASHWFEVTPQHTPTVKTLVRKLRAAWKLPASALGARTPLYLDGSLLPQSAGISILRENDSISVGHPGVHHGDQQSARNVNSLHASVPPHLHISQPHESFHAVPHTIAPPALFNPQQTYYTAFMQPQPQSPITSPDRRKRKKSGSAKRKGTQVEFGVEEMRGNDAAMSESKVKGKKEGRQEKKKKGKEQTQKLEKKKRKKAKGRKSVPPEQSAGDESHANSGAKGDNDTAKDNDTARDETGDGSPRLKRAKRGAHATVDDKHVPSQDPNTSLSALPPLSGKSGDQDVQKDAQAPATMNVAASETHQGKVRRRRKRNRAKSGDREMDEDSAEEQQPQQEEKEEREQQQQQQQQQQHHQQQQQQTQDPQQAQQQEEREAPCTATTVAGDEQQQPQLRESGDVADDVPLADGLSSDVQGEPLQQDECVHEAPVLADYRSWTLMLSAPTVGDHIALKAFQLTNGQLLPSDYIECIVAGMSAEANELAVTKLPSGSVARFTLTDICELRQAPTA